MTTTVTIGKRGSRVYPRAFDWDEARRLHAEGVPTAEIARRFGVTSTAVYRVVTPGAYKKMRERSTRWHQGGTCPRCGGPASRTTLRQPRHCRDCAAILHSTTVREDTLQCCTCKQWMPDDAFTRNAACTSRRGRHRQCTPCQTASKRDYRARNREKDNAYHRQYKRRRRHAVVP